MPEFKWPEERSLIGKEIKRLDGPIKVAGEARYSYDVNRPEMLYAKILHSPHAHARIARIDTARAERLPGVRAVRVIQGPGTEIQWALDEIAYVVAESEEAARDGVAAIEIQYDVLPHFVNEERKGAAPETNPGEEEVQGDPDTAFASAAHSSSGSYAARSIAHCCLEAHGQVCEWNSDGKLTAWASTQNVSGLPNQFGQGLEVPAADVRVITPVMGGGFGSKFGVDRWGVECARLAKITGKPVKLMLERDAELTIAGDRPSAFADIRVAADAEGNLVAWQSESWGSGGLGPAGSPPLPYVFDVPNQRHRHSSIPTHIASSRAWRAPNHPQGCMLTMSALEDLAAEMGMNPIDLFNRNLALTARPDVYREEIAMADELMEFRHRWHPRGEGGDGAVRQGLGMSVHTWGGRAHNSNCELVIHPDGSVEVKMGTQDLGVGTRTVLAIVAAETLGLPVEAIQIHLGDSRLPRSGASGGSTTVGGVSSSTRRAGQNALEMLFEKVAPRLEATAAELEARGGRIQVRGDESRSLAWKEATALLGVNSLTATGAQPGPGRLNSSGVGGCQMADVSVDTETGVVKINKMVAVQDCGLIIDMMTAKSQVYGALIMGISYALSEEKIMDPVSGRMLNADMEFYKLPGIGDVGELVVHMMTGPGYDDRGVIGLGEPPVISPGAAISNAVANAIGVRVPEIPITPDRVLAALEKGGRG